MKEQLPIEPVNADSETRGELQTVEDAVDCAMGRKKHESPDASLREAEQYLKKHPEDITEFCLQLFEGYQKSKEQQEAASQKVDKGGILSIAQMLEHLLLEKKQ